LGFAAAEGDLAGDDEARAGPASAGGASAARIWIEVVEAAAHANKSATRQSAVPQRPGHFTLYRFSDPCLSLFAIIASIMQL